MHICTKCGFEGDSSNFNRKTSRRYQSQCRPCQNAGSRAHYRKNKKYYIAKATRFKVETVQRIQILKGASCLDCGKSYPSPVLEFDHTDPSQKTVNVAHAARWSFTRARDEAEKCEVVCANCHRIRSHKRTPFYSKPLSRPAITKRREFVNQYKTGHPCMDCGVLYEPYIMEFDHREPSRKLAEISRLVRQASIEVIKKEIAKCDLVCANCHRMRTYPDYN